MPRTLKGADRQQSIDVADGGIGITGASTSSRQGTPRRRSPRGLASDVPALLPPAGARRNDRGGVGGGSKVRNWRLWRLED